ncbi:hypothetical protein LTR70_009710 [Exophiala xenobiotica]|uniref:Cullin family profile domain-containing protein n=1 Tax=Lithohypha guttulata TaxID=1690604 RepID=A0ABR0JY54_9EURO|nr:hypothetical protein LTR24_009597 [Lithohypha guttulata]KAK5310150.1 hypothetical protein LTR70_009710 [Exophiala xenobiotica]
MTPNKGKAVDHSQPSTSRSSSSKRKTPATTEDQAGSSTPPKKSRPSIAELVSSQGSRLSDGPSVEEQEEPVREVKQNGNRKQVIPARTFADMYTFASRTQPNGVIDLTQSKSPVSKPMNGIRPFGQLGQGGPKRLVVKNLRTTPKVDPSEYYERKWREQSAALDSLFQGGDVNIMLEELYKATEHICRQGRAAELFGRLKEKCTTHLNEDVRPQLVKACRDQSGTPALQAFVDAWTLWQTQVQTLRHIYFYLNQAYLIRQQERGDINTVGMQLFRSTIFHEQDIRDSILKATVELVQQDRVGNASHTSLLKAAVNALHDLAVYHTDFEPMLIDASRQWFQQWRTEEAEKDDLPHYVRSCSALLDAEWARCDTFSFDSSTRAQLSDMFDEVFVDESWARMSDMDGVLDMLEQDMDTEIEQCWTLLARKGHQQLLSSPYANFTETEGSMIVFDEKNEPDMVVRLLALKRKLDHLHVDCFHNDEQMGNVLHKSFERFMNKSKKSQTNWDTDNAKPGEMIAKHIDLLLKGGAKAIPKLAQKSEGTEGENEQDFDDNEAEEESVEKHLSDALDLFRFVHGKAVFEAFYKKDLARRLLMGRTQSFDAERSMLARLRNECGAQFTHNLESMFKDMDLAREEMKSYNQIQSDRGVKASVEISVNVLSVAAWPTYPDIPVNVPTSILKAQHDFEKHFKDKHVGRKLTWKPSLAHCQLKARFAKGVKELVVSGFQALVLLLFNDVPAGETLSYEQIKSATNLPDAEVKRTLQSLACGKYKVLVKTPKGRDVNEGDNFAFNEKFTDPRFRVKINQIQLKETKEENKETHQRVAADRHYETQAAIVRIMKARKKIGHNELIVEVIKATRSRGVLDQADIKKNIEKLIEKDYMEREDDIRGYSYLA